jgi:hypothetical protein
VELLEPWGAFHLILGRESGKYGGTEFLQGSHALPLCLRVDAASRLRRNRLSRSNTGSILSQFGLGLLCFP